jgi:hypothetical protein
VSRAAALGFAVAAAAAFVLLQPPVGDYWAARARESAALHGVGLNYWFAWFGGLVPGHYSVLAPFVSRIVNAGVLGAVSTVAMTVATHVLLRGSRHRTAATWAAAIGASFSLWSGRVPFAFGTAVMVCALIAVRYRRPVAAGLLAVLTAATSPVSAAFLILGLAGVVVHDRRRRPVALIAAGSAAASLLAVEVYFGLPGPEGFQISQALLATTALLLMLAARPEPFVRTVVLIALAGCPLLVLVPNGMGSNFERLTWICLPVAVLATARARPAVARSVCATAVTFGVLGSLHDLYVAAQPMSEPDYTDGLVQAVQGLPERDNHRLEIVPDGTHTTAFTLLGHAQLARGYETQTDNQLNAALFSPKLDAASFRQWLDADAVGWVALDRTSLKAGPEDTLVRHHRPWYLQLVWSDAHWELFAVQHAAPIVAPPARMVAVDQATMRVRVPAGATALRIRWSRLLQARGPGPALVKKDDAGWTVLQAQVPGVYTVS